MNKDILERFIEEKRDEFNLREPNPALWSRIQEDLPNKKLARTIPLWHLTRIAAAAVLILAVGVLLGIMISPANDTSAVAGNLNTRSGNYQEVEQYYTKMVNNKMNQLSNYQYDPSLNDDLIQLDEVFKELRQELVNSGQEDNEIMINALIMNYQAKIDVLERVLEKVASNNTDQILKNNDDETIDL